MAIDNLKDLGLETSAFKILCYLSFKDTPLKPSQIAEEIGEKPSTVRARLTELKNANLIEKKSEGYVSILNPYDILMKIYKEVKEDKERLKYQKRK